MPPHLPLRSLVRHAMLVLGMAPSLCLGTDELLPPEKSIHEAIDFYVDAKIEEAGAPVAAEADDAAFIRRLTLDLAGRIPSRAELRDYIDVKASDEASRAVRREALIDRRINSRWYVRAMSGVFNAMLKGAAYDGPDLQEYLLLAFQERRPWDQMFREMMGTVPSAGNPQQFVQGRSTDLDLLTRDASSLFFGLNISCAQCHVHPYVETLTQDHFFGMKAFFARSYIFEDRLMERCFGEPQIKYSTNEGEQREVGPMFLTGAVLDAQAPAVDDLAQAIAAEQKRIDEIKKQNEERRKKDANALLDYPENAEHSLRRQFVEIALNDENKPLFARSIINRLWHHFFGYGLVMRIDQMHEANPASHPELLDWLARDLQHHDFDLHRTIRGIVSSRAYARASQLPGHEQPPRELFAVANLRPLTPQQLGLSVLTIGDDLPDESTLSPAEFDAKASELEKRALDLFGPLIEQPYDDLQINATEALGMSNDPERLKVIGEKLVERLQQAPGLDQQIEMAVECTLSRPPTLREAVLMTEYLVRAEETTDKPAANQADVPYSAWRQVIWALCTSAEFRFNH